ncbi:putative quinol monooxygenase [uncultured Friedmanniella sp.]|uniref:putative quinol monooxygenase n=1 Tax=uncultured Friedmanniella sp. TaxID=335381 RepID=UPI0035CBE484
MPTGPVVVTALFTPEEGQLDALRAALVTSIPAVHAEPGCELYAIHDGADGRIHMIEKWTTVDDLDVHGAGEAVAALGRATAGLAADVTVTRMFPIPAGTSEQGLL